MVLWFVWYKQTTQVVRLWGVNRVSMSYHPYLSWRTATWSVKSELWSYDPVEVCKGFGAASIQVCLLTAGCFVYMLTRTHTHKLIDHHHTTWLGLLSSLRSTNAWRMIWAAQRCDGPHAQGWSRLGYPRHTLVDRKLFSPSCALLCWWLSSGGGVCQETSITAWLKWEEDPYK